MIKPEDIKDKAIARGISTQALEVPEAVILTFNRPVIRELTKLCNLGDWNWQAGKYAPYSSSQTCLKGKLGDAEIAVFIPPMGASPIAAFCEELIVYGARTIFLLCASWSLGDRYLKKGQIHVPSFAVGPDGTSYHYGNTKYRIDAEPETYNHLIETFETEGIDYKQGGVGCCEAFYRITRKMIDDYRESGCLSMENGEVAVLYALARVHRIHVGVLLQPYIDLEQGWDPDFMDDSYDETCHEQARIAVATLKMLKDYKQ